MEKRQRRPSQADLNRDPNLEYTDEGDTDAQIENAHRVVTQLGEDARITEGDIPVRRQEL